MLLNKSIYRRLSNAFEQSCLSEIVGDCPMLLIKAVYQKLFNACE